MDIGSLLLGLALLILVAAFVARPLLERRPAEAEEPGAAGDLLTERENVLAALRELDFDHATGKMAAEDYQAQRAGLVSQGATVLRQLDALGVNGRSDASLDAQIEAAVAARRRPAGSAERPAVSGQLAPTERACPQCGAAADPDDKFCHQCGSEVAPACPACGKPYAPGDRFCARCGARLDVAAETP